MAVSIAGVTAAQALTYYERRDEGYYHTEGNGEIIGKGAEALNISGQIETTVFGRLLLGQNSLGEQIVKLAPNGEHRAGLDITFSAPKSLSLLGISDERFIRAHERAVKEAIRYAEKHFSQARETHNGVTEKTDTGKLVVVLFHHSLSRALDPQIHTHAIVMNMTQGEDGKWRALSNEQFFERKMELGQVYRNALARIITQEMGLSIESDSKGLFEITGIGKELIDEFSTRSAQIEAKVADLKEIYPNAREQKIREWATLGSRESKKKVNIDEIRLDWERRLYGLGFTKGSLIESAEKASDKSRERSTTAEEYVRKSSSILTEQESTFTQGNLLKEAGKLSIGQETFTTLEAALNDLIGRGEIVRLRKGILTTMEMLRIESQIVGLVQDGKDKSKAVLDKDSALTKIDESNSGLVSAGRNSLKKGQKEVIEHILTSTDRVIGIQGDAGTGKTFALGVAWDLARDNTIFRGLAFTGRAASELSDVGIPSSTLHAFLALSENALGIQHGRETWIVDEASMVGSRQLRELLSRAESTNSRVILIGDTKQLQAIDAGNMFQQLQERGIMKTARMDEVVRQTDREYLDIVNDISAKRINDAFEKLSVSGRIIQTPNRDDLVKSVISDYTDGTSTQRILVTTRNSDRHNLNNQIRSILRGQGKLVGIEHMLTIRESKGLNLLEHHFPHAYSPGDIIYARKAGILGRAGAEARVTDVNHNQRTVIAVAPDGKEYEIDIAEHGDKISVYTEKERPFSIGDKVVFLKNDRMVGVNNGTTGYINHIDDHGNLDVIAENGKDVRFQATSYPYIDHGYAVTDYKSQGQTAREVLIYSDTTTTGNTFNSFYVSITRGKDDVRVYTDNADNLMEQVKLEQSKKSTLDYVVDRDGKNLPEMISDGHGSSHETHLQEMGKAYDGIEI